MNTLCVHLQDRWWFSGGYRKVDSGRYVLYSLVLL
ncbi:unnamed protein product [Brassica rapa subsp. trilocularis]|uniref:Uncharacterized protein n=1 Tax=Brassica oleracea TaxID=3712 RepID=A0A3P6EPR0_BRAOL|nr:unnamed protein product [Brassica oleracea]